MSLIQKSVLNKYLKTQDQSAIDNAFQKFSDVFLNAEMQKEIKSMKEEEYQDGFLDTLFADILGYIKRPKENYNLTREQKNVTDGKKADGAILKDGVPHAVIELKATNTTDLDKVTTQAFGYKNNNTSCHYVITSNFAKLRFFIDNAVDYFEFNLFSLTKEEFKTLWLCLQSDNLLSDLPLKAKKESVVKEENITKQLYKDYSTFKTELWESVCENAPEQDKLVLFKKTQKLLDRFLFIFFAEDSGLLPPNSITRMVERYEALIEMDADKPLYEIFKQYFGYINKGRKGKTAQDDIYAYNGGLFKPDDVLDSFIVDDEMLKKHVLKMTAYDFQSDVDVNILGHIFENSLNDIENVTAQLEGHEVDKSKTKRKKDGVFYTPKYITKYMVENTVGKLCNEKKNELGIVDEEYAKGSQNRKKETIKKLDKALQSYREWLLDITICDPACGSGAFLNQALEFLIAEHTYIDELNAQLMGATIVFQNVSNQILERNIFGVDINDESVEIAKLSLWLRTAERGRKLTSLNNNIKCGNSLIDDPTIAGDKAFNWEKEFPEVFAKGGFDVIIGNPPYGVNFNEIEKVYLTKFDVLVPDYEIYIYFISLYKNILKKEGVLSYIFPNTFLSTLFGIKYRQHIFNNTSIDEIVDLSMDNTFTDASVRTIIFTFSNTIKEYTSVFRKVIDKTFSIVDNYNKKEILKNVENIFSLFSQTKVERKLINKIKRNKKLSEYLTVSQGYIPYRRSDLIKKYGIEKGNKIVDEKLWHSKECLTEEWVQEILGKELRRYYHKANNNYFKYGKHVASYVDLKFFSSKRILIREITSNYLFCDILHKTYVNNPSLINIINEKNIINLEYTLLILNSKLIGWLHNKTSPKSNKGLFPKILINDVRNIPIAFKKNIDTDIVSLIKEKYSLFFKKSFSLSKYIESQYSIEKLPKKLQNWYELDFKDFIKELNKAIKKAGGEKLTKSDEMDWMQTFEDKKAEVLKIQSEIDTTDKEIDQMVYDLYELTPEEIQIVENS